MASTFVDSLNMTELMNLIQNNDPVTEMDRKIQKLVTDQYPNVGNVSCYATNFGFLNLKGLSMMLAVNKNQSKHCSIEACLELDDLRAKTETLNPYRYGEDFHKKGWQRKFVIALGYALRDLGMREDTFKSEDFGEWLKVVLTEELTDKAFEKNHQSDDLVDLSEVTSSISEIIE